MHELTTPFALRTARVLMDAGLAMTYADPHGAAREAADRARQAMEIEAGSNVRSYSAAERLMLFAGDVRWLSAVLYDAHQACRVPPDRVPPFHRLPAIHDLTHLAWEMEEAERNLARSRNMRRDEVSALRYLASRLEAVDSEDLRTAAQTIRSALDRLEHSVSKKLGDGFYDSLLGIVTRSLDRGGFPPEYHDLLSALEVELSVHVYRALLAEGKLVRREFIPTPRPERRGILRRLFAS